MPSWSFALFWGATVLLCGHLCHCQGGASVDFRPLRYTGNASLTVGNVLRWKQSDWMLPFGTPPKPQDWSLSVIAVPGEPVVWANVISWTTSCGFLEWNKETGTITYKAEIDGCMDSWTYIATKINDNSKTAQGKALINIMTDNCIYSNCQPRGCGKACKCNDKKDGSCFCGSPKVKTGYERAYVYSTNSEACFVQNIVSAGSNRARNVLSVSVAYSKIAWPFTFDKYDSKECIPGLAFDTLRVRAIKMFKLSAEVGSDKDTPVEPYGGAKAHKDLLSCSQGVYKLVVNVPAQPGRYACSIFFNDGSSERQLGILKVLP